MKSLIQFLSDLRAVGVVLAIDGERLIINAPKGAVTSELRAELAQRKAEILAFLRDSAIPKADTSSDRKLFDLPLSRSQQRLWFISRLYPDNPVYHIVMGLQATGTLDRYAMERAFKALLERHEALRTSFYEKSGTPFARIHSASEWVSDFIDLSDFPNASEEALRLAKLDARRPFAFEASPLFRVTIFRISKQNHLILIVVHHIVADGWSLGILANEFAEFYAANVANRQPILSPITFQYRDYVQWELTSGQKLAADQMPYWLKQLHGPLPVVELPGDYKRPSVQTFSGHRLASNIDSALAERIGALCRASGTTPFMLLFAAFNILISRYTGLDDLLIGTATSNRQRQEVMPLVGFFINNLVLRTNLSGSPRFIDLLHRVKEIAFSAYAHQDMPFDLLVERIAPERGLGHSPLIPIMFTLQNVPMSGIVLPGLETTPVQIDPGIARADLAVEIWPQAKGFRCEFEYNSDLFDEPTIRQMQSAFIQSLQAVVSNPEMQISQVPLLLDSERRLLLEDWNKTERPSPPYSSFPAWFRAQAAMCPDTIALAMGSKGMTYAELDSESDRYAEIFSAQGAKRGVVVGIYLLRSHEMVITLLAILKSGATYLPLDPAFPSQRIEYLLADARVELIVTHSSLSASLTSFSAKTIHVDQTIDTPKAAISEEISGEDIAYLIYTSGSTGAPKGTQVPHRALTNLLASMLKEPGLTHGDTLIAITTLSFDIAALELLGPLVCGAKVVIASREQTIDPIQLAELIATSSATVMQGTPSTWRMLAEAGWMGDSNLRMWCGGEALTPELSESLLSRGRELWNLYGPTETTIWSAAHLVKSGENPILIGHPIANTTMYILDSHQKLVPLGVPGELYIGGRGVARGYLNLPELTASHFVADPFTSATDQKMYRTGDLARYRRDGQIQLLGRTDHQIKLRGHRIEIGEIEVVLERHPEIVQAVISVVGEGFNQQLVAFVKYAGQEQHDAKMRNWLQEQLPEYMVPSVWVPLAEIPLTPNGKIDRKRLRDEFSSMRPVAKTVVSPGNQVEFDLVAIWKDVLGLPEVSVRDNFFDIGGHSLLLIRVHSEIRERLDAEIAVVDLFRYPTIESLSRWLVAKRQKASVPSAAFV